MDGAEGRGLIDCSAETLPGGVRPCELVCGQYDLRRPRPVGAAAEAGLGCTCIMLRG